MNIISRLDTHQGFATSFRDQELTDQITQDTHADGLNVSSTSFPKLKKSHPDYQQWLAAKSSVEAVMLPRNLRAKARSFHKAMTLPTETDGEGILVESLAPVYDARLVAIKSELMASIPKAIEALPTAIEYARTRKNGAFREDKYPTAAAIQDITFEWSYKEITCGSSKILMDLVDRLGRERAEQVKAQIIASEQARLRKAVESALVNTVGSLCGLSEMLANPDAKLMTANLANAVERAGIAKSQMHDLLGGDGEVDVLFDQVLAYMHGIDLAALKKDASTRAQIAQEINGKIAAFGEIGKRKFNL